MVSALYTVRDDGTVDLNVHAEPGAGRTQITGRHGNALKVRVAVPPEHGRANAALITVLADAFGLPAGAVVLVSGDKSRSKRFRLTVDDIDAFADRLDDLVASGMEGPGPVDRDKWRPPRG